MAISEDRKTAQFRESSGHTDLCATKSFSKGLHRSVFVFVRSTVDYNRRLLESWRIKVDGLDSMGYWIGIGCTIDRSQSFNYSDSIHFGYSSVGNKLGNVHHKNTKQHSTTQRNHNTTQHNATQHNATQHTIPYQCNATQHNATQ